MAGSSKKVIFAALAGNSLIAITKFVAAAMTGSAAKGANRHVVAKIRAELDGDRDIEHVNEIATLHMGPAYIVVTLSVNFRDDMISQTIERSVARLDRDIKALDPRIKRVFIEAEAIATQTVATAAPDAAQTPA